MAAKAEPGDEHVARMRRILLATCAAAGVASAATLRWDAGARSFSLADSRVGVVLDKGRDGDRWRVTHSYETMDLASGRLSDVSETVAEFALGDEVGAVRAAVLKVVETVVDFAIGQAC